MQVGILVLQWTSAFMSPSIPHPSTSAMGSCLRIKNFTQWAIARTAGGRGLGGLNPPPHVRTPSPLVETLSSHLFLSMPICSNSLTSSSVRGVNPPNSNLTIRALTLPYGLCSFQTIPFSGSRHTCRLNYCVSSTQDNREAKMNR